MNTEKKGYEIAVNGSEFEVAANVVTYEEVVEIGFPKHPHNPDVIYAVTFEHADQRPEKGPLAAGGKVIVKKSGTIFDVTPTNRS